MNHYSSTKQIANQKTKKNRVKVAGIKKEEANIKNNYSENEINNHINYKKITTNNWDRNNIRNNYCYTINHRDMDTLSQGKTNKTNIIKNSVIDEEGNRVVTTKIIREIERKIDPIKITNLKKEIYEKEQKKISKTKRKK